MSKSRKKESNSIPAIFRKPRRQTRRLTEGEFDTSNYVLSSIGAQQIFLKTVRALAPEVLTDLRATCFEFYCESGLPNYHPQVMPGVLRDIFDNNFRPEESFLSTLKEKIWSWSDRWNLGTDWCRERAFFTLVTWASFITQWTRGEDGSDIITKLPTDQTEWSYGYPPTWITKVEIEEFTFQWAWHPLRTQRSVVDAIARALFDEEWRKYLDDIEERFIRDNEAKRSLNRPKQEHFDWLVLYQIKGLSAEEIFAKEHPSIYASRKKEGSISEHTKFIRKAYNKLANFIYLPLRIDRNPPKRKALKKA